MFFNQKVVQGDWWKECLDLRQQMSHFGVVIIVFFYDKNQQIFELPYLFTYGFLNMEKNKILVQNWRKSLHKFANHWKKSKTNELKSQIKEKMLELLSQDLPKSKPAIVVLMEGL